MTKGLQNDKDDKGLLLIDGLSDEIAAGSDDHSVDRRDAPLHEIGDHGTEHNTCDSGPVDLTLGNIVLLVSFPMGEIAANQYDAHRREGAVKDIQPFHEVPVEPDSGHGSDQAGNQHHSLLGKSEKIRKTKTGGVEGVVIGGPDVQSENEDGDIEQVEVEHNLENVVTTGIDAGDGTEEEHQGVADEESHNSDNQADLRGLGEPGEVGSSGTS